MNIIFFDDHTAERLLPLTFLRPVVDVRVGILTIREKWQKYFGIEHTFSDLTRKYLNKVFPVNLTSENIFINGSVSPSSDLFQEIKQLELNMKLTKEDKLIAAKLDFDPGTDMMSGLDHLSSKEVEEDILVINDSWDIFQLNDRAIREDFKLLTSGRQSAEISDTNTVIGEDVFVEEGAKVECAILNSKAGPIYIGKSAEVMEGTIVRGALALCDHATLKLGAKIYGATTIGPHSKVGGEVGNSVIFGYSNKGHDGYMGNSILAEWCNLGADTNTSNLKNNYGPVKVWSYKENGFVNTGLQFCGLTMGDHSKSSINSMFNTGTVVGVFANVFGGDFPSKFIHSFAWGGAKGFDTFKLEKAFEVAERMMERRGKKLSKSEKEVIEYLFKFTERYRG